MAIIDNMTYQITLKNFISTLSALFGEWHTFCDWIETLPYSELITGKENN